MKDAAGAITTKIQAGKFEILEVENERWAVIDQALEIAALLPESSESRASLLSAAAKVWIMRSSPVMMLQSEVLS